MYIAFARAEKLGTAVAALAALALAFFLSGATPARAGDAAFAEPALPVRLFGSSETANADISPFPKWTAVLDRYARERQFEDAPCTAGNCALRQWKAFVAGLAGQDRMRQLEAVNAYANRIPYRSDMDRYGVVDYWATPRESLGRSADCEDYAIVKYLSLRKLGWPAEALRLVVLKHEMRNELHAVLVAYLDGTAYVLDNLAPDVREHAAIPIYRPIFSINELAWYFHRDWNPDSVVAVAQVQPRRVPGLRPAPGSQIAGVEPPAIGTAGARPTAPAPAAYAGAYPAPVRPAAPSSAGNAGESLASRFSDAARAR